MHAESQKYRVCAGGERPHNDDGGGCKCIKIPNDLFLRDKMQRTR